MLDFSHFPTPNNADIQMFTGSGKDVAVWQTWAKPRGKSMAKILLIGNGGNGGSGVIGANSTAGGGGGGGSGGQTAIAVPLCVLPDMLYISVFAGGSTNYSRVSIAPDNVSNNALIVAANGGVGGNASGGTGGTAGNAGSVATGLQMPLGWQWLDQALAGQAGIAGSSTGNGGNLVLPVTGLLVTGGTGGAGLNAAGASGSAGGAFNASGAFPLHPGGVGGNTATTPPGNGVHGYQPVGGLTYFYGGTGGGSSHGSATGAGLVQSSGGNGAIGCGGGGSGGALTDSSAGLVGLGGSAICIITCW